MGGDTSGEKPIKPVKPPELHSNINADSSDSTDGLKRFEWESRYPAKAKLEIRLEMLFLSLIFVSSHFLIFATWKGWITSQFTLMPEETETLKKYLYFASSGMLGGVTFGIKYFYRAVARGWWHQGRRIWRLMSPMLAMTVALIVGTMIDASLITTKKPVSGAAIVSIGFLAGYFADEAIGKMYEIANVLFGKSSTTKDVDGK